MSSTIRHLSAVAECDLFAAAEFKETVHIFQTGTARVRLSFPTNLDFGGRRLQIAPNQDAVFAGAYAKHGLTGYQLATGKRIWHRPDLKKIQRIRRNPNSGELSCFCGGRAGQILSPLTGVTLSQYRGVNDVYFNHNGSLRLEECSGRYRIRSPARQLFTIKPESFAILDAVISPDCVGVTESAAALRFFSLKDGALVGRYTPKKGYHILSLCFDDRSHMYICLLWGYESEADYHLVHISQTGEEAKRFRIFNCYEICFLPSRRTLVNAAGQEIDWDTGVEVFRYEFPNKE